MGIFIHADPKDQDPDIPGMGEGKPCDRQDCPGQRGWEVSFGLAGGGCGVYHYCPVCERVVEKDQERDSDEA